MLQEEIVHRRLLADIQCKQTATVLVADIAMASVDRFSQMEIKSKVDKYTGRIMPWTILEESIEVTDYGMELFNRFKS